MAALLKVNFSACLVSLAGARTEPSRAGAELARARTELAWARTELAWAGAELARAGAELARAAGCLAGRTYSQVFLCNVSLLRGLQGADQTLLCDGHCVSASL
jgi:uncharacterized membrane protein YidH (DUF202 family)